MYHFFAESSQLIDDGKRIVITDSDYNHMVNVLRMKAGEEFSVSFKEEEDKEYRFGIESISDSELIGELRFVKESGVELPAKIYLFQGLPKADKMELIIQKAVELGVYRVIPVSMKRSVVKLDEKRASSKIKRWQAISEAAAKQSKRAFVPEIDMPMSFKDAVKFCEAMDVKLLPYEQAEGMAKTRELIEAVKPGQSIAVFVGPEGGFADEEVAFATDSGFNAITMGKRILRTETAGFTMLSWLMYHLEP
ncbi:16S rRNA (uracil(1498)-N(3))-methyltransferase [Butyrivibrio sp. JL13D10]|uniref:16S rRNA (uracil(1498)-N(3))-methyltransferase n=1 Tax=Butyrivibrio sp. JL13D10 TaxID=3236815 RepID=UPI0038B59F14